MRGCTIGKGAKIGLMIVNRDRAYSHSKEVGFTCEGSTIPIQIAIEHFLPGPILDPDFGDGGVQVSICFLIFFRLR